jgi:hypothetical protein
MAGKQRTTTRVGLALLACGIALGVGAGNAQAVEPGQQSFTTPGLHDFRVPDGVFYLTTSVEGGHGGGEDHTAAGGSGGGVDATIPVRPGETLRVYVGAYGGGHGGDGWKHGGDHGTADGALNTCHTAAGGGGSSAVVRGTDPLVGAGGGGGGGGDCGDSWGGRGGAGGARAGSGQDSPGAEPPDVGFGACGACHTHSLSGDDDPSGADGHNATEDVSGGGGGGGGAGTFSGGDGGEDGSIDIGHTGSGGGGGGAGDSAVPASGALRVSYFASGRGHDGAVALSWGAAPSVVTAQAGSGQTATILADFATGLRAKVTDKDGIPSVGVPVRFSVPDSGPAGTFGGQAGVVRTTGTDGVAAAPALRANTLSGAWTATATVVSSGATARYTLENRAATTATTVSANANPSVTGQAVQLKATVRSAVPGAPATGLVQFLVDGTPHGDPVTLVGGTASAVPISDLPPGAHDVEARYRGDTGHAASTGTATQRVDAATTATTFIATPNPANAGEQVAMSAQVSVAAPAAGVPTGRVQFFMDNLPLNTVALDGTGRAVGPTFGIGDLGSHVLRAVYTPTGDGFLGSEGSVIESVNTGATSTVLSSSANPATAGTPTVVTANVRRHNPGATVTGQIAFSVDGTQVCGPAPLSAGSATCTLPADLAIGAHQVRADFTGDPGYADSYGTYVQQVQVAYTSTQVSAEPDPLAFGGGLRLHATVSAAAGPPDGTVTFSVDGTSVGAPVPVVDGEAVSDAVSGLLLGTHLIEADYAPAAGFEASHGTATTVVAAVGTRTTLASSATPVVDGRPFSLTVGVAAVSGTATPAGSVQLVVDDGAFGAPVPLINGRATIAGPGDLGVGAHTIVAEYHGYGPYDGSQATLTQQVDAAPSGGGGGGGGSSAASGTETTVPPSAPSTGGPGPVAMPPQPRLTVGDAAVTVDGQGTLRLALTCVAVAPERCTGTVVLRTGRTTLASRRVSLAPGAETRIAFDVTRAGERQLERHGRLEATLAGLGLEGAQLTLRVSHAPRIGLAGAGGTRVRVSCARACHGSVRAGRAAGPTFALRAGHARTIGLALDAATRAALRRHGHARVTVRATSTLDVGRATTTTRTIEVRA